MCLVHFPLKTTSLLFAIFGKRSLIWVTFSHSLPPVRGRGTLGSDFLPPPPARPMLAARATPEKVDMLNFCSTGEQKKGRDKARGEGWSSWKYFYTLEPSRSLGPLFSRREPLSFLFHPLTLHFIPPRSLSDHPGLTAEQAQASGRDKT